MLFKVQILVNVMFLRKVQVRFQFNVSITEIEFTIYLTIGTVFIIDVIFNFVKGIQP